MQNQKSALGLDANVTALLGYIIWIVALVVVLIDKENKFVRFHAIQSLLYTAAIVIAFIALTIVATFFAFISYTLASIVSMLSLLVWLAALVGIIVLAIKSFQGTMFKLPIIGDMAEKWA
jgi:uncharacterized membrane protein